MSDVNRKNDIRISGDWISEESAIFLRVKK